MFMDGGYAVVLLDKEIPQTLELEGRNFKLAIDQEDPVFWIYLEKPPYCLELH